VGANPRWEIENMCAPGGVEGVSSGFRGCAPMAVQVVSLRDTGGGARMRPGVASPSGNSFDGPGLSA